MTSLMITSHVMSAGVKVVVVGNNHIYLNPLE